MPIWLLDYLIGSEERVASAEVWAQGDGIIIPQASGILCGPLANQKPEKNSSERKEPHHV